MRKRGVREVERTPVVSGRSFNHKLTDKVSDNRGRTYLRGRKHAGKKMGEGGGAKCLTRVATPTDTDLSLNRGPRG